MNREEFEQSLQRPLAAWGKLNTRQVEELIGPEVAQMVDFDQKNPHHCYKLFLHCLHTVEHLHPDAPMALRVAAFFHDIGKPYVSRPKQEKLVFYGHAKKSAEVSKTLLEELGYTPGEVEMICFYILHHDDFMNWELPNAVQNGNNPGAVEISPRNLLAHIQKTAKANEFLEREDARVVWTELLRLCRADALSQAELVYRNGVVINSKAHKLEKVDLLMQVLKSLVL